MFLCLLTLIVFKGGYCTLISLQREACQQADFSDSIISCSYSGKGLYYSMEEIHVKKIYFNQFSEGRLLLNNLTDLTEFVVQLSLFDTRKPCNLLKWENGLRVPPSVAVHIGEKNASNYRVTEASS